MKKKMSVRILALLLALVCAISVCGCGGPSKTESEIESVIEHFEDACQTLDLREMLNCMDPKKVQPIQLILSVIDNFTPEDLAKYSEELVTLIFGSSEDPEGFLRTLDLTVNKVKAGGKDATVTCNLSFTIAGQTFNKNTEITMVKRTENKEDFWYIQSIKFTDKD